MTSSEQHTEILSGFVTSRFGERYIYEVNRGAFEATGAEAVFQQHFGTTLQEEETLFIIIGTDSGLLPEYLLRQDLGNGSRYLFVELPELTRPVRERLAEQPPQERIALASPEEWFEAARQFGANNYFYLDRVRLLLSIGAADANLPAYRELKRNIQSDLNTWSWGITAELGSSAFTLCELANLADNHTPAIRLRNAFPGQTAVLLAGGPSLDLALPWVKQHREQLTVFAVSRVCRRLLQEGLIPDLVFSIDPTSLSFDISKELLQQDRRVLFVNAYHVNPGLLGQWGGRSAFLGERFPWVTPLNPENIPVAGPTVTNTALAAAVEMGYKQIVLAGVDLCFSPDGYTHAVGSNEHKAGPALGYVGLRVKTNAGEMADTETSLAQAIHDIARQAKAATDKGCRFINPAPNAAEIPGVDHIPLDGVVLAQEESAMERLTRLLPAPSAEERRKDLVTVEKELLKIRNALSRVKELAEEALECNDGLFGRNGKTADFKYKLRMDKIERRLDRDFKNITPLVKRFGIARFIKMVRVDLEQEWEDHEVEQAGRTYYEAYRDGADNLGKAVEDTLERIRLRQSELNAQPDMAALFARWERDRLPGRALLLAERRPELFTGLPESLQQRFEALKSGFENIMGETETSHMKRCRAQADLKDVRSKAQILFLHNDIPALSRLAVSLEKSSEEEAKTYQSLLQGYLAELAGDDQGALAAYQELDNPELVEEALRRISAITLKHHDFESATTAVKYLTEVSPSYLPQLAELYRLQGDAENAANTYANYLQHAPDDLRSLLKLGDLYLSHNVLDGARWVFNHVLEKDPGNQAARKILDELDQVSTHGPA